MIFKDKKLLNLLIIGCFVFFLALVLFFLNYRYFEEEIIVKFDRINKIFLISEKSKVFFLFFFIFLIFLVNIILAEILYFKERFTTFFLLAFNIFFSILFLFYVLILLKVN